jgi:DNA repair protein SbcC/Rad50
LVDLQQMRKIAEQKVGRRNLLLEQQSSAEIGLKDKTKELEDTLKARSVIQIVAKNTQKNIEFHISGLVTMALATIFPEPYEFQLRFVERRNTTEADLIFLKNGNETDDILNTGGGGVADVASFVLRIALWSLKKTRPTFILDEPDKFLHSLVYQEKTSEMMKELCKRLGIQIIMISDQQNIIAAADKIIRIKIENGVSYIDNTNGDDK